MDKNFIGERISELRLKKNVSEYQMSLDLGKNKSYIQSLTSGRSLPTMQSFLDICDYLEVTPRHRVVSSDQLLCQSEEDCAALNRRTVEE